MGDTVSWRTAPSNADIEQTAEPHEKGCAPTRHVVASLLNVWSTPARTCAPIAGLCTVLIPLWFTLIVYYSVMQCKVVLGAMTSLMYCLMDISKTQLVLCSREDSAPAADPPGDDNRSLQEQEKILGD